ncbi:hypothetical protein C0J52_04600 [Blattella germanica]|nr:hypothetical protein C0J52_04600 [Blattella germanica]
MECYSKFDFKILKLQTILQERRVDLSLFLSKLQVEGFYAADRMSHNDYDSKAAGYFWLTLGNLTGEGIAMLQLKNNSTFEVDRMRLTYAAKNKRIKCSMVPGHGTRAGSSPRVGRNFLMDFGQCMGPVPTQHREERKTILQKIWRDLTYNLNKVVQDKVNPLIKKTPLKLMIKNKEKLAKYTDYVVTSTESANNMVDIMIDYAKNVIMEKYQGTMKIPDINEGFEKKVLFVTWKGGFLANQGKARGLTTVERIGDTVFANDNNSMMHFHGTLGFENVNLFYEYYKAHFMGIGPTGKFGTKLYPLDLYVHCHIDFTGRRVYLDEFKVMKVGDMEVKMEGWGWLLDFLVTKIATWVGGLFKDKIVYDLQNKYDKHISELLGNYDLDDILEGKFK